MRNVVNLWLWFLIIIIVALPFMAVAAGINYSITGFSLAEHVHDYKLFKELLLGSWLGAWLLFIASVVLFGD